MIQWLLVICVCKCFLGALLHFLEVNDRTTGGLPQLYILWSACTVSDSPEIAGWYGHWKQWIIHLFPLHITFLCSSSAKHKNVCLSLWPCKSQLISFPAAIYPSLQPSCFPSIIICDPQMTLRDSCYLKHMRSSSSRQRDGERGKREGVEWRGGDPLGSQVLFSCCAHVLCMALLCIFQGPSGHGALYIYTHKMVLSACSQLHYMV